MQLEADHFGNEHRDRLAKHRGLCLDAADTPAQHTKAIHHRRMRIRTDERIRIGDRLSVFL